MLFRPDKLVVDDSVDESLESAFSVPSDTTLAAAEVGVSDGTDGTTTMATGASTPATAAGDAPEPELVATGSFVGVDHDAAGTSSIFELDGEAVLRFEDDTDIQNGPDLFVWLVAGDEYDGGTPTSFLDLGKLKGNVGGQNYALPEEFDADVHRTILIWCVRFGVPFAAASLS